MRKLLKLQRPLYDSLALIGVFGVAIGFIITVLQVTMNLVGFEDGRPTGKVIKDLRAEVRSNKLTDDTRDSLASRGLVELRQLVLDNKLATENNTAILCVMSKSPLPFCSAILKSRGLK